VTASKSMFSVTCTVLLIALTGIEAQVPGVYPTSHVSKPEREFLDSLEMRLIEEDPRMASRLRESPIYEKVVLEMKEEPGFGLLCRISLLRGGRAQYEGFLPRSPKAVGGGAIGKGLYVGEFQRWQYLQLCALLGLYHFSEMPDVYEPAISQPRQIWISITACPEDSSKHKSVRASWPEPVELWSIKQTVFGIISNVILKPIE